MTEFSLRQNEVQKTFRASQQGSKIQIELEGETAVFHLIAQADNEILLERTQPDGSRQQWRLIGHKDGTKRTLWLNGRTHHYERALPRGMGAAHDNASLASVIPAVVADILVSEGDKVEAGDKLILLESMKMVIPIQAPYAGIVKSLNCTKGESVQAGAPLIELDEA